MIALRGSNSRAGGFCRPAASASLQGAAAAAAAGACTTTATAAEQNEGVANWSARRTDAAKAGACTITARDRGRRDPPPACLPAGPDLIGSAPDPGRVMVGTGLADDRQTHAPRSAAAPQPPHQP
eukprot:scaffold559_cov358-Prasinococcus_capsulatus_cf.AAC.8